MGNGFGIWDLGEWGAGAPGTALESSDMSFASLQPKSMREKVVCRGGCAACRRARRDSQRRVPAALFQASGVVYDVVRGSGEPLDRRDPGERRRAARGASWTGSGTDGRDLSGHARTGRYFSAAQPQDAFRLQRVPGSRLAEVREIESLPRKAVVYLPPAAESIQLLCRNRDLRPHVILPSPVCHNRLSRARAEIVLWFSVMEE